MLYSLEDLQVKFPTKNHLTTQFCMYLIINSFLKVYNTNT